MANRKNTFLLKRSNIAGKVPAAGDLLLGELALNIADVILYASGTTTNSILPIGWDRLARTGDTMTGGLFTPYLSATTISATSINKVDYIVFNTGTTSAATVAGTVYFDNNEHALSYNTSINQGVTVNLGQQNYLRVFNNSGTDIPRGKALEILSAYSGLPSVTLAINKHTGFNIIGVSAEIIPNNSEGIAITNGIISNIELTGMTVGSLVYASDSVAGRLDDATKYLSFPLTARTNQVGFVIKTGTTTGKLFVNINNENSVLSLTDLQRNVLEGNVISTGVFEFTGLTTYSTTTINIASAKGWIVNNTYIYDLTPDVQYIEYSGGTNISLPNINSADSTFILLTSASTIHQQTTFPTPQERRENIYLGKVNHPNRSTILNVLNTVDFDVSPMSALRDLWTPIKLINQGILVSPNGSNLSINTSAGTLWGNGINWVSSQLNPDSVSISAKTTAGFFYRTQSGGTGSTVTVIDPTKYDVNGVITSMGVASSNHASNQRVYLYPTGVINILYGQTNYATLTEAVAGLQTETFTTYPNASNNGILIGTISVRNDIVADGQPLTNPSYAVFTFASKFGELLGGTGGLSTTTLQQAYNNSTSPEIVINATLDGLSIKNGTGNSDITTRLLEGLNAAGNATSFIRADGDISGTTLQTNGFTGNTTGMSALTVNIRTIGSGTPLTNLGIDSSGNVVSGTTGGSTFTGGTITGPTNFTNGLTANTISATTIKTPSFTANNGGITATTVSATTYYGLPIDIYSTGGTYNGGNIYVTNNTGGTFTITGLTASGFSANYYGSFSDSTTQTVSGANIASVWKYNTTELSNGISISGNSQIKVANKGVYEIGYSAQIEKTQGTEADVTIWAAINGIPVTRSSSVTSLVANSALQLPFVSYMFELNANDYVEFYFSSSSQYVQLTTFSGLTTPTRPNAPSVIIVAKQVGLSVANNLNGYYLPLSGGTVTGGTVFTNGLTANTISATTYYNLPIDIRVTGGTYSTGTATFTNNTGGTFTVSGFSTGTTVGNGTINYLPKWTGTTALGNSLIRDDGTNIGVNTAPEATYKVSIYSSTGNNSALYVQNQNTSSSYGIYSFVNSGQGSQTAIFGNAQAHPTTGTSIGVFGFSDDGLLGIGVKGSVGITEFGTMTTGIGGSFDGRGDGGYGYPSISYSVQLLDGTEGVNKVLVSKTSDGKSNWSSTLSGLTLVSATTIQTNGLTINGNLTVTGDTQSLFSGNSSVELIKIIQNGSGDAFVVEDISNGDSSHFVINASGNTAIGLIQPLGNDKLTISGNTSIYGNTTTTTLSATSITADTVTTFIPIFTPLEIYRGITFQNNSTTVTTYGGVTMATSASNLAQSVASTNFVSKQIRLRYFASVVSGGRYTGTRGSALLWFIGGGFRYVCDFNISDTAFASTCQQFYGLANQTTDLAYGGVGLTQVSTLTNLIGLGNDGTDTNLQIIHNDSGGTATKIDLGVNFPANRTAGAASTTVYSLTLYNAPASNNVKYMVINNETGAVAMGTMTTNLPDPTLGLNFFASRAMGGAGGVTNSGQFDLLKLGVNSLL